MARTGWTGRRVGVREQWTEDPKKKKTRCREASREDLSEQTLSVCSHKLKPNHEGLKHQTKEFTPAQIPSILWRSNSQTGLNGRCLTSSPSETEGWQIPFLFYMKPHLLVEAARRPGLRNSLRSHLSSSQVCIYHCCLSRIKQGGTAVRIAVQALCICQLCFI